MKHSSLREEYHRGWQLLEQEPDPTFERLMRAMLRDLGLDTCKHNVSIGRVRIEGEFYTVDDAGDWCFLTPCYWINPERYWFHVFGPTLEDGRRALWGSRYFLEDGSLDYDLTKLAPWTSEQAVAYLSEIVDIVAWHPATPQHWARRVGNAEVLGTVEREATVHRTILDWLRDGCRGCVFLEHDPALVMRELFDCDTVFAADKKHERWLLECLTRPFAAPKVTTR